MRREMGFVPFVACFPRASIAGATEVMVDGCQQDRDRLRMA
jgi:hypothetical protein